MSYDELNQVCKALYQENQNLTARINDLYNTFQRANYLFKVLDAYNAARRTNAVTFDLSFVESCIKEIQTIMEVKEDSQAKDGAND